MTKTYILKIGLIGNYSVGKSCILDSFVRKESCLSQVSTIGVDFRTVDYSYNDINFKLQIWDTAGQEQFANIVRSYLRQLDAIIYVFDLTEYKSLKSLNKWITEVNFFNKNKNIITLLAGNKADLTNKYQVSNNEIETFNSQYNMKYVETSIKDIKSLNNLFSTLIEEIYHNLINKKITLKEIIPYKEETIEIKNKENKCCNYL